MNPFDIVKDINYDKRRIITASNEKQYNAFMVNRSLSYFPETILYAQEMNMAGHLDSIMQYDYLFHSVRKSKRFSKWVKEDRIKDVELIAEYFGYSYIKAKEAYSLLTKEQILKIKEILIKGKE